MLPVATGVLALSPQPAMAMQNNMQTQLANNRRMAPPREKKLLRP
ncbi:MAG: hypothetical protein ACYC0X_33580 [Pirellulaceae bacterium]